MGRRVKTNAEGFLEGISEKTITEILSYVYYDMEERAVSTGAGPFLRKESGE